MRSTSHYSVQTYLDAAEQETALRGWGQRYVQLAGGKFAGSLTQIDFGAVSVGEESETVETVAEPFLLRLGFITRGPRGREATPAAWRHLGATPPVPDTAQLTLSADLDSGAPTDG